MWYAAQLRCRLVIVALLLIGFCTPAFAQDQQELVEVDGPMKREVYYVDGIEARRPKPGEGLGGGFGGGGGGASRTPSQEVGDVVSRTIEPAIWRYNGGSTYTITALGDVLIVTAPQYVQDDVSDLLAKLASSMAKP